MSDLRPLGSVDLADAERVFDPPGAGEGHWVGAPCVHRHRGRTYLAVRWRDPERRGYAVDVYERTGADGDERTGADGDEPTRADGYVRQVRVATDELGVRSVERPSLVTDPETGALRCYLPVDHGRNDWTIQALDPVPEPAALDPDTATDVLTPEPGSTDAVTVKDPHVVVHDGHYWAFYAGHDGTSERAHLAVSDDGRAWERVPENPVLGRSGWHDHHTRVACVLPPRSGPEWTLLYGGSGTDDVGATWNLRTGVAVAADLASPTDRTPDAPALAAPHVAAEPGLERLGACRYVDVLRHDGGDLELFAEVARPDGSFDLRRALLPAADGRAGQS